MKQYNYKTIPYVEYGCTSSNLMVATREKSKLKVKIVTVKARISGRLSLRIDIFSLLDNFTSKVLWNFSFFSQLRKGVIFSLFFFFHITLTLESTICMLDIRSSLKLRVISSLVTLQTCEGSLNYHCIVPSLRAAIDILRNVTLDLHDIIQRIVYHGVYNERLT